MSDLINRVWEECNVPLKRFISKRVRNEQDAEDILQEVFVKINNNIGRLKNDNKMHGWIYKIARNTIIDFYRKKDNDHINIELPEKLEGYTEDELSANTEIASCLKNMVDRLPDIYQQAVLLTEFQNLTQKELSEKAGISISGGKSRVQRARKMLKEMLQGCCRLEMDKRGNIIDYEHRNSECIYC